MSEPVRYRCVDYAAYYAGDEFKLFDALIDDVRYLLPAISELLLKACESFRTLDEHAAAICQRDPFRAVPIEAVRELLDGLAAAGLLTAQEDLAARCTRLVGEHRPVRIETVGILTWNRPGGLERAARSSVENAARHGRRIGLVVADDSDEGHQAANLAVLADLIGRYDIEVWYAGPREKAAFARTLAEHCGVPLATVKAALRHAEGWPAAPGANRNALLLHTVGEAFLTLDDDMVCKVARLPEGDDGLSLTSIGDPTEAWYYTTPAATLQATRFVDEDFLALHESLLGHNVGRLVAEWRGDGPLEMDQLGSPFLANLAPDGGSVTYTMAGVLGDSGLRESLPYFFTEGASLDRLLRAEGGHRGAMASRQMGRGVLRTTIGDTPFCMGANIGLDNRALLPPFQMAARNEDGVFSALVRSCIPGSFIGFLPRTILHDPVTQRRFPVERFQETVGVLEAAQAILQLVHTWPQPPARSTTRQRLISLGGFLVELGELTPAEFEVHLRQVWMTLVSGEAAFTERALRLHGTRQAAGPADTSDAWSTDLRRYLDTLVERMGSDGPVTLRELEDLPPEEARATFQRFLREFGGLLCAWPDLVEGARELRERGVRLGRRVTGIQ